MKRNFCEIEMNADENISKKVALVERNPTPNGIPLVSTIAIAKKSPNDLVELAMEIQKADQFVNATACSKLQVIAEQVRFLQGQAQKILLDAKNDKNLHHAACNFKKIPGNIYYLYKRPSGQLYFSMLSPQEWTNAPHEFMGGYRLEADLSWTPLNDLEKRDTQNILMNKILSASDEHRSLSLALEQPTPMDLL